MKPKDLFYDIVFCLSNHRVFFYIKSFYGIPMMEDKGAREGVGSRGGDVKNAQSLLIDSIDWSFLLSGLET